MRPKRVRLTALATVLAALALVLAGGRAGGHTPTARRTLEVVVRPGGVEVMLLAIEEGEQARALRERADTDLDGRLSRRERRRLCELAVILAYAQLSVISAVETVTLGAPRMEPAPGAELGTVTVVGRARWKRKLDLRGRALVVRSEGAVATAVVVRDAAGKIIGEGVATRGAPLVLGIPR